MKIEWKSTTTDFWCGSIQYKMVIFQESFLNITTADSIFVLFFFSIFEMMPTMVYFRFFYLNWNKNKTYWLEISFESDCGITELISGKYFTEISVWFWKNHCIQNTSKEIVTRLTKLENNLYFNSKSRFFFTRATVSMCVYLCMRKTTFVSINFI